MPTVLSRKVQEVHPPLLDDEESYRSSDSENLASPTRNTSTEFIDKNVDQDVEQNALCMQDHFVESDHESDPPECEEASMEEEEFLNEDSNLTLGEWINLPRRSRRIAGHELSDNFEDVEPL